MPAKSNVEKELDLFGKRVVKQSRASLTRNKHNDTKELYNSISYDLEVFKRKSFAFSFSMQEYGQYQDQGVKGKTSSLKAPNSPFKFGSGTGKKGGLTKGINLWVRHKRFQFRDTSGRFLSFDSTAFIITRSIYNKGLKPTRFFTRAFELAFEKLPEDIVKAYALDLDNLLKQTTK